VSDVSSAGPTGAERAAQCLRLAETHLAREDLAAALAPLAEAHGLTSTDPRTCFMYAQTLARVGHMADARQGLRIHKQVRGSVVVRP
jgi:Flp pilus assembly protein TadD